jgi:hypothetical protein
MTKPIWPGSGTTSGPRTNVGKNDWGAIYSATSYGERFREIADETVRIEWRTNLLFSFEKMAVRDAVRSPRGARYFALGLYDFLYGTDGDRRSLESWCGVLAALPRKQTRVLTWPIFMVSVSNINHALLGPPMPVC